MGQFNFSEFSTLTQCERKWYYAYGEQQEEPGEKRGLHLGTLCHQWYGSWLRGEGAVLSETWTDDINTGGKPGEVRTLSLEDFDPELVTRATWLAGRFAECYGASPSSSWTVIGAEEWMTRDFEWGTLVGRADGFVEHDGHLWLIELKSYGSKPGPLAYAQVSPQLGVYSLLAEAHYGKRPFGVLYQGIYTYQWKRAKPVRLPEESFDQIEVELGIGHLLTAQQYLAAAVDRRAYVKRSPDATLPNIGSMCRSCGFRPRCWSDLGGVEEFEIEVEDEGDVPR